MSKSSNPDVKELCWAYAESKLKDPYVQVYIIAHIS